MMELLDYQKRLNRKSVIISCQSIYHESVGQRTSYTFSPWYPRLLQQRFWTIIIIWLSWLWLWLCWVYCTNSVQQRHGMRTWLNFQNANINTVFLNQGCARSDTYSSFVLDLTKVCRLSVWATVDSNKLPAIIPDLHPRLHRGSSPCQQNIPCRSKHTFTEKSIGSQYYSLFRLRQPHADDYHVSRSPHGSWHGGTFTGVYPPRSTVQYGVQLFKSIIVGIRPIITTVAWLTPESGVQITEYCRGHILPPLFEQWDSNLRMFTEY